MKADRRGWLKNYLDLRTGSIVMAVNDPQRHSSHPEYTLYRILQPTGLLYGHAIVDPSITGQLHLNDRGNLKILLAETLISSALVFNDKALKDESSIRALITTTLERIGTFYNTVFPEITTSTRTLLGRKKSPEEVAEQILDKRVEYAGRFVADFWSHFFHNSLLFLDVFIFGKWIHTNADRIVSDFFRYERDELRFSAAKVIAAAAHANRVISIEERRLYDLFMESTTLSADRRKEASRIFEGGLAVEELNLPAGQSWLLKKFYLEIAILTVLADMETGKDEIDFLDRLRIHLGFSPEDLENSLIAVEGFMLEHWKMVDHREDERAYAIMSEHFIDRVAHTTERNKTRLIKHLKENEALLALVTKARGRELSTAEKQQLRDLLIALLKSLPVFGITPLPDSVLTLPVLMRILPQSLFTDTGHRSH